MLYLTERDIAEFAKEFGCQLHEVEARLNAGIQLTNRIAERLDYKDPYGYARNRPMHARGL